MEHTPPRVSSPVSSPQPHDSAVEELSSSPDSVVGAVSNGSQASNPPPNVTSSGQNAEAKRHPKGKRKRTAAIDKATLEAAYTANPKPDKAARLDIVKRVSLNEKEVQIWFQNRRQNDRRKTRPLSPQEIAAFKTGGMQLLSSSSDCLPYDPAHSFDPVSSSPSRPMNTYTPAAFATSPTPSHGTTSDALHTSSQIRDNTTTGMAIDGSHASDEGQKGSGNSAWVSPPPSSGTGTTADAPTLFGQSISRPASHSPVGSASGPSLPPISSAPPILAGQADEEPRRLYDPISSSFSSAPSEEPVLPPPSSQVRISLSLDGKAQVVSHEPSPPRLPPPRPSFLSSTMSGPNMRRPSLSRRHSSNNGVTLPPISALTNSLPRRLSRGRSRDVQVWEFCCDSESRDDELTMHARNESQGSAIAAISLLRSTSSASSLQSSGSVKRNAPSGKRASRPGQSVAKKPKLSRSYSSVGRLQTSVVQQPQAPPAAADKDDDPISKPLKVSMLLSPSGNDSDKENWTPDKGAAAHGASPRPRNAPLPSLSQLPPGRKPLPGLSNKTGMRGLGRVLEGRHDVGPLLLGSRALTAPLFPTRRRGAKSTTASQDVDIFEDAGEEDEQGRGGAGQARAALPTDEVERFMRGEVSPSKKGDMDCVAGLLSLSQGNWR